MSCLTRGLSGSLCTMLQCAQVGLEALRFSVDRGVVDGETALRQLESDQWVELERLTVKSERRKAASEKLQEILEAGMRSRQVCAAVIRKMEVTDAWQLQSMTCS
jgi:hypothetical protein